jgi:hypothetical protein
MARILLADSQPLFMRTHTQNIPGRLGMHSKLEAATVAMQCLLEPVSGSAIKPG